MPSACCQRVQSAVFVARPSAKIEILENRRTISRISKAYAAGVESELRGNLDSSGVLSAGGTELAPFEALTIKARAVSMPVSQQTKYIDSGSAFSEEVTSFDLRGVAHAIIVVGRVRKRSMMALNRVSG
jgi:hypothetical protein